MALASISRTLRLGGLAVVCALASIIAACGRDKQWDLTDAAAKGDLAQVKRLFEAGAKLDAYPQEEGMESGSPALLEAVRGGHDDVVRFFIEHGADLEITWSDVGSPLANALNHYSTTKLLLDHGASVNHAVGFILKPNIWDRPLDPKIMDLLKSHGAITKTTFKRVPPTSLLCMGQVVTESGITTFLVLRRQRMME